MSDLRILLEGVRSNWEDVVSLLGASELQKPRHAGSTPFDWSAEDALADVAAHANDPRAEAASKLLARFQGAISAALEQEIREGWDRKIAAAWIAKCGPTVRARIDGAEARAEVAWVLRGMLARKLHLFDFGRGTTWMAYCAVEAHSHLREWLNRATSPVEVPRAAARDGDLCNGMRYDFTFEEDKGEPGDYQDVPLVAESGSNDPWFAVLEELTIEQRRRIFG